MLGINKQITNFYIHIPFCIKKCYFCAFPIHAVGQATAQKNKQLIYEQYCSKVQHQINLLSNSGQSFGSQHESIYFGGGTPSLLSSGQISSILNNFRDGISKKTEISLQMNPQQIKKAEQFIKVGINRLSIGIQSLNKQTLSKLNRGYKTNSTLKDRSLKQQLKQLSKTINMNLDFIIDFNNREEDRQQMLQFISFVRPKHLSLYILEINEGSYLHRNQNLFSNYIGKFQNYQNLSRHLTQIYGYDHYQVSNYSMPGYQSIHNNAYWMGDKQFGAFGMGATSLTNKMRITRPKNLSKYYQYVEDLEIGKNQEKILETLEVNNEKQNNQKLKWVLLSRLRRKQGITWSQIKNYLLTEKQVEKQSKINKVQNVLNEINNQKPQLIDMLWTPNGIRLIIPQGFLYTDYIGYKIIDSLNL